MGFRTLRVINEDRVAPGKGFDTHPHRDMEIISYVLEGKLAHKDSMGNGSTLEAGAFQRITAGSGVMHSEYNPSEAARAHFYQIWIEPKEKGLAPSYEELRPGHAEKAGRWITVASPDPLEGGMKIHQDVRLQLATLSADETIGYNLAPGRHAWLQVTRGTIHLDGHDLSAGDGASISEEEGLTIAAREPSEVLLFDLQ